MPAPTPATATTETAAGQGQSQSNGQIDEASSDDGPKGAEAHRQSDEEEEGSVPPIPPEAGGGGDGGIGSGTQPPSTGAGGTTIAGISVRTIAIAGGVAIAGYLAYRYFQGQQHGPAQALGGGSTGQDANPEPEDAQEPEVSEEQARTNGHEPIPNNPDDPLQADHEAGKQVFGWES